MSEIGTSHTTWRQVLSEAERCLFKAGIREAELDAWYLFSDTFGIDKVHYLMDRENPIPDRVTGEIMELFWDRVRHRQSRKPLQYILGVQDFMGMEFEVGEAVLIPRQDTETLVETILAECPQTDLDILDMCTGSGCIAVSLKRLGGYGKVTGVDLSENALAVAKRNGDRLCGQDGPHFLRSDMFEAVEGKFDVLVSNPPYIPSSVIDGLEPEVRDHEPRQALDGNEDGLLFYRRLAAEAIPHLKEGARIYFEIGYDQAHAVSKLLSEHGFGQIRVIKDGPGLDRVVMAVLDNLEVLDV